MARSPGIVAFIGAVLVGGALLYFVPYYARAESFPRGMRFMTEQEVRIAQVVGIRDARVGMLWDPNNPLLGTFVAEAKFYLKSLIRAGETGTVSKYGSIEALNPSFAVCAAGFLGAYKVEDRSVRITSAYRTQGEQDEICASQISGFRCARNSDHSKGLALDIKAANQQALINFADSKRYLGIRSSASNNGSVHITLAQPVCAAGSLASFTPPTAQEIILTSGARLPNGVWFPDDPSWLEGTAQPGATWDRTLVGYDVRTGYPVQVGYGTQVGRSTGSSLGSIGSFLPGILGALKNLNFGGSSQATGYPSPVGYSAPPPVSAIAPGTVTQPQPVGQPSAGQDTPVNVPPASLIIAQPLQISTGRTTLVSWVSVGMQADSCRVSYNGAEFASGNQGSKVVPATFTLSPGTLTFVLTCTPLSGTTVTKTVNINVQ